MIITVLSTSVCLMCSSFPLATLWLLNHFLLQSSVCSSLFVLASPAVPQPNRESPLNQVALKNACRKLMEILPLLEYGYICTECVCWLYGSAFPHNMYSFPLLFFSSLRKKRGSRSDERRETQSMSPSRRRYGRSTVPYSVSYGLHFGSELWD